MTRKKLRVVVGKVIRRETGASFPVAMRLARAAVKSCTSQERPSEGNQFSLGAIPYSNVEEMAKADGFSFDRKYFWSEDDGWVYTHSVITCPNGRVI